jgi:hypothetical protein
MAAIIGVTPDIETSKWNLEREFRNARNWKVTAPFKSKKEANEWEKKKADELQVKTVKQKIDTTRIRVEWRGFYFEHDGRK